MYSKLTSSVNLDENYFCSNLFRYDNLFISSLFQEKIQNHFIVLKCEINLLNIETDQFMNIKIV